MSETGYISTIVIGGGQAGLAAGYFLKQHGQPFVIFDAGERIGDVWRNRWDSLRLFTPARYDGLPGLPFPGPAHAFPTKGQMADYLESYARRFELPVRTGTRIESVSRKGSRYLLTAGRDRYEADHVIVAMARYQNPKLPSFARDLRPDIVQLHSKDYRRPDQLNDGGVLIVGAGNSGADIAMELSRTHPTWLAGRDTGHVPFRIETLAARVCLQPLLLRVVFHHVLSTRTPIGRRARPKMLSTGGPLIRVKPRDLRAAGVERAPRVAGVQDGLPLLQDGRVLDVSSIIWCTGFHAGFSWIDVPVFDKDGMPEHDRGVVRNQPGLYFLGLPFIYSFSSAMIHGVGRDAEHIAGVVAMRARAEKQASPAALEVAVSRPA